MSGRPHESDATPRRIWAPWIILCISLGLTAAVTVYVASAADVKNRARFESTVQSTQDTIQNRVDTYVALLRATAAHLTTGPTDESKFATYVANLALHRDYPGVQGIGYSVRIPPADKDRIAKAIRDAYYPKFRLWPDYKREQYHAIVWLEPLDRRNQAALGYDMFTEPVRRAAMERARDTAEPVASGKVTLVQEVEEKKQAGFLVYVPVYLGWLIPPTVQERRERLLGYVYSPFRCDDLLAGTFADRRPKVAFEIYDGPPAPENLLHRSPDFHASRASAHAGLATTRTLALLGQNWTIRYRANQSFEPVWGAEFTLLVLLSGIAVSALLATISWKQARARLAAETIAGQLRRAQQALTDHQQHLEQLVRERTHQLERSHQQLRHSERLASIGTLATGIAHEINNPVNAILLSAEYALTLQDPAAHPEVNIALHDIIDQSKRCGKIVRNVLRFARHEESRRAEQDLNALVRRAADLTRNYVGQARLDLQLQLDPALPHVTIDAAQIEQVIINLIQNAAQAGDGVVQVILSTARENGQVLIRIADNGRGIPREHLQHIFDPFFSTRREKGGTGLGLSMAHGIIAEHNGAIQVESGPGQGATFTIHLPATA